MIYHVPTHVQRPASETVRLPHKRLVDFRRVSLDNMEICNLEFVVNASSLGLIDSNGNTMLYAGTHQLWADRGHGEALTVNVTVAKTISIDTLPDEYSSVFI